MWGEQLWRVRMPPAAAQRTAPPPLVHGPVAPLLDAQRHNGRNSVTITFASNPCTPEACGKPPTQRRQAHGEANKVGMDGSGVPPACRKAESPANLRARPPPPPGPPLPPLLSRKGAPTPPVQHL